MTSVFILTLIPNPWPFLVSPLCCIWPQVIGLGEINLEEAEFMMQPRTITEVEVQLQKADPSIDVLKLVKARPPPVLQSRCLQARALA